jgi:type IV pilus assembly protein PilN
MIRINLLPVRAQIRKESVRQLISIYLLSVAFLVVGILYLWVNQSYQISSLSTHLQSVQAEVAKYAKYDKMLKELQAKKEILEKKRQAIVELQQDRDKLVRVMALLSVYIPPERLWFEKLSQAGGTITVEGVALSNETIAEFMRNLESSPYVDKGSVNLVHSRLTTVAGMRLREFRMTCIVAPFSAVQERIKAQQKS